MARKNRCASVLTALGNSVVARKSGTIFGSLLVASLALTTPVSSQVAPDLSGPAQKTFRHPGLKVEPVLARATALRSAEAPFAATDLVALGVDPGAAFLDSQTGRWARLQPVQPMIPGKGTGNELGWQSLGVEKPRDANALRMVAGRAFNKYLRANAGPLRIDPTELAGIGHVTSHADGALVQIHVPRVHRGIPVRDSYVSGALSHGNLVLMGANKWADINVSTQLSLPIEAAWTVVEGHAAPYLLGPSWGKNSLEIVTLQSEAGRGLAHRLVHVLRPGIAGEHGRWEALVDAHTGELISFEDANQYASREVQGGVYPVSNDGIAPDGVEQPGWPMPFDTVVTTSGSMTTDIGGNVPGLPSGDVTSTLSGQFVNMNDNCGSISLTAPAGNVDFGTSGGTDCTTPGFGGGGNTHASRSGFFELNMIAAQGRGQLPANTWLQEQLTANMNINLTCNAFWNGSTVNFYRSGGGCFNTGEIAGVFDHEWGHGMDDNDANPSISSNGSEGIADIYAALRLNTSCIGRNFRGTVCAGFGDPCLTCTGVRDIDWAMRASGVPHTLTWVNANCGGSVHCIGVAAAESVWDLYKRDLPALYGMDNNTALEVTTRLTYLGAGAVGTWFSGSPPNGGCGASSGYMNYLAADDDNGDLNDGTPHMAAIFAAFDRHEIACATTTVQDSGCIGAPAIAPEVTGTPFDRSAQLSWDAVAGASKYQVFRTDGVYACDFGKIKVGETAGTSFVDTGLQNGRGYHYVVLPIGSHDSCMGPASACSTVLPAEGPNIELVAGSQVFGTSAGDGDAFLDNCETGTLTFDVINSGLGSLTNARIVGVTPVSHPTITILTAIPAAVAPSTLAQGASGVGSFSFLADGLAANDTVTFDVELTADEIAPLSRTGTLTLFSAESDLNHFASHTFTFESGAENWQVVQGTFNRNSSGGGAQETSWYENSSEFLNNQCDHIRSPVLQLSATSTLSLWSQYDIEPIYAGATWYDRANVGIYQVAGGTRTSVDPDGGRLYNASGANGTCGTAGQNGWADGATTWEESTWTAAALGSAGFAGSSVQLDIRYGTDFSINGFGLRFDEVTVTDFDQQVADGQSDVCAPGCTLDADCDNGDFCDGAEVCNAGTCEAGTAPVCDDGVSCTVDSCNEGTDSCDNTPDDLVCDNGFFCDGGEYCDPTADCQPALLAVDCSDGVACTDDSCNETTDSCDNITNDSLCDNGLFCDGAETCDAALDCQAGTPPTCDDGVGCTVDSCNEGTQSCDNAPSNALCDNGEYCDGAEVCDAVNDCQAGSDPCPGNICDETGDQCVACIVDADCDNGLFCDGAEVCNAGVCQAGTPPTCDDGVGCTVDSCNAGTDSCDNTPDDLACNDGLFCNGGEFCDAALDCQSAVLPVDCSDGVSCTNDSCNEGTDSCDNVPSDALCDNGLYCDGTETCDTVNDCQAGSDPCPGDICDEGGDQCVQCVVDADCDNGLYCDGTETCNAGVCQAGTAPVCDDGLFCNGTETCDESSDSCSAGTAPDCGDGVSCTDDSCNEGSDSCDNVPNDSLCDNGLFCDGNETCDASLDCQAGAPVDCGLGMVCNETTDICEAGATDSVAITEAKYTQNKDELRIKATSSEYPDAVLEVVGYGEMTAKKGRYELKLRPVAPLPVPDTVTVLSSYGGSASRSVDGAPGPPPPPGSETVTITKAEWRRSKGELKVEATSSAQPGVTLTLVGFGQMEFRSGKYRFQDKPYPNPGTVTVTSSGGATATKTVKIR